MVAPLQITVLLCSHNPRQDYIEKTLYGLKSQTFPRDLWELIIVDNCSKEPLAERIDLSWHPNARIVVETRLGLTPARLRGMEEALGELFILVDDDNVLDSQYLSIASTVSAELPFVGSWSGQCLAEFDQPPPLWTRPYWGNLCVREFDTDIWSNMPRLPDTMPAGAGLCVRRAVAEHYLYLNKSGARSFQFDRAGDLLISGGDADLAACACDIGLGVGLVARLKLKHLIPPWRLEVAYLARLAEGIHFSSTLLDAQRGLVVTPRSRVGRFIDTLRIVRRMGPHGRILSAAYSGRDRAARLLVSGEFRKREHNPK